MIRYSNKTFDLRSILKDVFRNIWILVLMLLIGLMGLYVYRQMESPQYTSRATLVVNSQSGTTAASTGTAQYSMTVSVSELFMQPLMAENAAEYMNTPSFNGKVKTTVMENMNIFDLSVTADSPADAYACLCALLSVYHSVTDAVFSNAILDVVIQPEFPVQPDADSRLNGAFRYIGFLLVFTVFLIGLLSVLRDTVKNEEFFRSKVDAPLFATIRYQKKPRLKKHFLFRKNRTALLIDSPFASPAFVEDYKKIATKLSYKKRTENKKLFLVTSIVENEGKSTCAANVAMALAEQGESVMLLDFDFIKPAQQKILGLSVQPNDDIGALLEGKVALGNYRFHKYKNLNMYVCANAKPHPRYVDWIGTDVISVLLKNISAKFDYVIIDTPPMLIASDVLNLSKLVDETLLLTRTDGPYVADVNEVILSLRECGCSYSCILNDVCEDFSFLYDLITFDIPKTKRQA